MSVYSQPNSQIIEMKKRLLKANFMRDMYYIDHKYSYFKKLNKITIKQKIVLVINAYAANVFVQSNIKIKKNIHYQIQLIIMTILCMKE